jgi:RNA polymerase sigma factor for flagellar operon FliA
MVTQAAIAGTQNSQRALGSHVAGRCNSSPNQATERNQREQVNARRSRRAPAQTVSRDIDAQVVELLPLVKRMAFQMREHLPAHVEVDDLVGAGTLGLLDAVRKFDASKHVKLESYARHRIRGAILDGLRELDTASRDMRKKNKKAEKVYRELEAKLGRPASSEEMAQALGISLRNWYRTVKELQPLGVSWLWPMEAAEAKQPDEETLVAETEVSALDLCYRREQREILRRAMDCLSERDRRMMSLYYEQEKTMKEIGEELGIDESRVSQLHSTALVRLQARVKAMLSGSPTFGTSSAYEVAAQGSPQTQSSPC